PSTMTGMASSSPPNPADQLRHVRPARPLHFPAFDREEERLGQSPRHLELCFLLYALLRRVCAREHSVRADEFIYWHSRSPKRCLAPDAFVKLGPPRPMHDVWKVWED